MPNLIIHIGQNKTGTTSLQRFLRHSEEELIQNSILYPKTLYIKDNHHSILPLVRNPDHLPLHLFGRMGFTTKKIIENAQRSWGVSRKQIEETQTDTIILSSEGLFSRPTDEEALRLKSLMADISEHAIGICYVRSPASRFLSTLQQGLKTSALVNSPESSGLLATLLMHRSLYGEFIVAPFERAQLRDKDIVSDFFHRLGLGYPEAVRRTLKENTTLSAEAMVLLQEYGAESRKVTPREIKRQRRIRRLIRRMDAAVEGFSSPRLKSEVNDLIVSASTELLPLRDEFGIEFEDVDYDLAGNQVGETPKYSSVSEVCEVDRERLDKMRRALRFRLPFALIGLPPT